MILVPFGCVAQAYANVEQAVPMPSSTLFGSADAPWPVNNSDRVPLSRSSKGVLSALL